MLESDVDALEARATCLESSAGSIKDAGVVYAAQVPAAGTSATEGMAPSSPMAPRPIRPSTGVYRFEFPIAITNPVAVVQPNVSAVSGSWHALGELLSPGELKVQILDDTRTTTRTSTSS